MPQFQRYIGVDYSGAKTPRSRLRGLRVYASDRLSEPTEVSPPEGRYWNRADLAAWLVHQLREPTATLVGIDHGFSFPMQYFETYHLGRDWLAFLDDFRRHWPTDGDDTRVDDVRKGRCGDGQARMGNARWRRLTERRAGRAKAVFHFDVQGSVAKSTHAGLPWIAYIRQETSSGVRFWPFDGWDVPAGHSAVVEVYPALWRRLFSQEGRTDDQQDAYAVSQWLRQADAGGSLQKAFHPPLEPRDLVVASIEGWILGVMDSESGDPRRPSGRTASEGQKGHPGAQVAPGEVPGETGFPIHPERVRYIKLGAGGGWEKECLEKAIIRLGFESADAERFALCRAGKWDDLRKSFMEEGRDKGTATRFTQETRLFFEDQGSTLWLTFVGERLCWGFLTQAPAERHPDGKGVYREVLGGWRSTDRHGEELTKDRLSGALTKVAAYRGTSCTVDVAPYVIRRINGEKTLQVERALVSLGTLKTSMRELMSLLEPRDFETLVDLVFTTTGWRRLGPVGKSQKTLDLDLVLPTTGERAFVQVKSKTTSDEAAKYAAQLEMHGPYDRMFFVFHSGEAEIDDERVTILGPDKLAEMVIDAGLVTWLIRKVS